LLDACVVQREADEVTSVRCGELLAVEALVLSATEQEIAAAFDDFAVSFGGAGVPRRVESEYAKGDARYKTMRLEGDGPRRRAARGADGRRARGQRRAPGHLLVEGRGRWRADLRGCDLRAHDHAGRAREPL
jgi:hypothetical protein